MHFKDNRAAGTSAFANEVSGGASGIKKIGFGDSSIPGRSGGSRSLGVGAVGGGCAVGCRSGEVEETLQDAIVAEKVGAVVSSSSSHKDRTSAWSVPPEIRDVVNSIVKPQKHSVINENQLKYWQI